LTWRDKLRVGYGLACLVRAGEGRPGESFAEWLRRHHQSARTIKLFWATVLVSALNERLEQMDVGHAHKVFASFLSTRDGLEMEVPLVPLGELYGSRLENWLRNHDVEIRLTTGVRSVNLEADGTLLGVMLRSGELLQADFVVLAVSFDRLRGLLPEVAGTWIPQLHKLDLLESSPITGIHLWFDRPICPYDHVVLPGRLIQWVFNHTAIQGRGRPSTSSPSGSGPDASGDRGQYLQIVISASYDLVAKEKTVIRDAVLAELKDVWPEVGQAQLLRWWVVTEHGATFAVRPGVDRLRLPQRTPVDGLFLAGDWTLTGWPATMEGAVRSGYLAGQGILKDLDRPARLLLPELEPAPMARWLLGGYPSEHPVRSRPPGLPIEPVHFQAGLPRFLTGPSTDLQTHQVDQKDPAEN
jgi:squalene-associated FAD-dependent desaturase